MAHSGPRPAPPAASFFFVALLAAKLVTGSLDNDVKQTLHRSGDSSELLSTLRRQLMADNEDYMPSESDEFPALVEARRLEQRTATEAPAPLAPGLPTLLPFVNDIYIPRAAGFVRDPASKDSAAAPRDLDKNDLLYYMEDEHLSRRAADLEDEAALHEQEEPLYTNSLAVDATPKPKYKLLKMKVPGGSRRAGAASFRRFVKEESASGLALINLGDEPFPEFRLPSESRQYMSDRDAAVPGSELEIIVPTDLDAEPLT